MIGHHRVSVDDDPTIGQDRRAAHNEGQSRGSHNLKRRPQYRHPTPANVEHEQSVAYGRYRREGEPVLARAITRPTERSHVPPGGVEYHYGIGLHARNDENPSRPVSGETEEVPEMPVCAFVGNHH